MEKKITKAMKEAIIKIVILESVTIMIFILLLVGYLYYRILPVELLWVISAIVFVSSSFVMVKFYIPSLMQAKKDRDQ